MTTLNQSDDSNHSMSMTMTLKIIIESLIRIIRFINHKTHNKILIIIIMFIMIDYLSSCIFPQNLL